ncbi:fructosamine kinase [Aphelenchoides avenae]|nr:fructosamine kinase [Aphelenchus avenae]
MEAVLKEKLHTSRLEKHGRGAGGCISKGGAYATDDGVVFVKTNSKKGSDVMFAGELASLQAIEATSAIRVPHPIGAFPLGCHGEALVTEYLEMSGSRRGFSAQLGRNLAKMHLHNAEALKKQEAASSFIGGPNETQTAVRQFGFDVPTCCGFIPQCNEWTDDWATFYVRQRLKPQVDRIIEESGDRDAVKLWPELERAAERILASEKDQVPSIVHGDLWSGNWAATQEEPVIFDPASFYGTSEYEFGIMHMFGGFDGAFHRAYGELIPKREGFEKRAKLYELFHHLNHWNHFGTSYKGSTLALAQELIRA